MEPDRPLTEVMAQVRRGGFLPSARIVCPEPPMVWRDGETCWTTTRTDPWQAYFGRPGEVVGVLDVRAEEGAVVLERTATPLRGGGRPERDLEELGRALAGPPPRPETPGGWVRREVRHRVEIDGDADTCFALACPVAELDWIDGWHFDLIASQSGRNETGCVFAEPSSGLVLSRRTDVLNRWYTTRYDPQERVFEAIWMIGDLALAHWELKMTARDGRTRLDWHLVVTALDDEGRRVVGEAGFEGRMRAVLEFLATSLKRYVETGRMYRLPLRRKARLAASVVGASVARHLRRRVDGDAPPREDGRPWTPGPSPPT